MQESLAENRETAYPELPVELDPMKIIWKMAPG